MTQETGTGLEKHGRRLFQKALEARDASELPIWFRLSVLDRYRGQPGYLLMRTNSAGRIEKDGGWRLDFAILDQEGLIHIEAGELLRRLPRGERDHWIEHLVTLPLNEKFVKMRLGLGVCLDEGDIRDL